MTHDALAVIGGGASATLLLAHLAALPQARGLPVDVYDRTGRFATGIAYSTPHLCHLLNVRASNMSALAHAPADFSNWAARHGYAPADFVPRRLYGEYLREKLAEAQRAMPVTLIGAAVESCIADAGGFVLTTKDGQRRRYRQVIDASGNSVPLRPRLAAGVAGYHDSPWVVDYPALKACRTIALVGTGLSAVDVVLALQAHGYDGDIIAVSRRGLWPGAHVAPASHVPFMPPLPATALDALRCVRAEVEGADVSWQAVIDSLRAQTNALWQSWPAVEQARFMRRLLTYWNVHRHRMAPQIAGMLAELARAGRLKIVRASVAGVASGPSLQTSAGPLNADAVINCLGYRYREKAFAATACLGPACFGPLFETTAIPEIRAESALLAARLTA